jgi:NAD(P)-dependent dehydrogenase (short-subunit alcohol dehydrogenase family)
MIRARPIRGSRVVVLGATSGIGRATALSLAASGARLVLAARSSAELGRVAAACTASGGEAIAVETDVRSARDIEALCAHAVSAFGGIDTWINTAAVLIVGALEDQPVEDINALIATNVLGTALASRAAISRFREQGHGVLINTSSMLGVVPNPVVPTYTMSKFAVRGLSLSLHAAFPRGPIRVCTIMPGPVDTPMFQHAANYSGQAVRAIPPAASPERVAATIIRSVRRPRRQRTDGFFGSLIVVGEHVLPRLTDAVVATISARLVLRSKPAPATSGSVHVASEAGSTTGGWRRVAVRARIGDGLGRRLARRRAFRRREYVDGQIG